MKREIIQLPAGVGGFAEDKDEAKRLRIETILPAFEKDRSIVLDFSEMKFSTQSFVHALLGEVLQRYREDDETHRQHRTCSGRGMT